MVGVKTNIITSVEVTKSFSNDSPHFVPLVKATARNFTIREVSGDKAYSSRANLAIVDNLGGTPYIPFKAHTRGNSEGRLIWHKMFKHFKEHKQDFLEHYHKRSNVESTFNMIKQKLGGSLMTKTFTAQKNEILAKILIHNLLVLVQEYFEQSLEIDLPTEARNLAELKIRW